MIMATSLSLSLSLHLYCSIVHDKFFCSAFLQMKLGEREEKKQIDSAVSPTKRTGEREREKERKEKLNKIPTHLVQATRLYTHILII